MTLHDIINLFERSRGGMEVPDCMSRDIAASLRAVEQERDELRREVAAHRTIETAHKRAAR